MTGSNSNRSSKINPLFSPTTKISYFNSTSSLQNSISSYSIPKETRFRDNYKKFATDSIYSLPDSKSYRGASIGFGVKSSLIRLSVIPSPNEYNIKSVFELNKIKGRGNGESSKTPGPQSYTIVKPVDWKKQSPPTFKFRHGFYYDEEMKYKGIAISPQKYSPNYKSSEYCRYKDIQIGIGLGEKNFWANGLPNKTPGPGQYNLPSIFDKSRKNKSALN